MNFIKKTHVYETEEIKNHVIHALGQGGADCWPDNALVCLSLLLIVLSLFGVGSPEYIILILLIGNILEYRVAGKMRKEASVSEAEK